jgi:outer membrane biosynthesis protein TonB
MKAMSRNALPRRMQNPTELRFASVFSVVVLLCVVMSVSGCARVHAKAATPPPALDVPPPPARTVEPLETKAPPAPPPEESPRPAGRPSPPSSTPPVAARPAAPAPAPASEPPKPPEEPPKPAPPTTLQTTPAAAEGEVERGIRATLARATTDLGRIDYRRLNVNARTQYDTAKRFIQQADAAIQMKNLMFAKNLADKAAALATQLAGK